MLRPSAANVLLSQAFSSVDRKVASPGWSGRNSKIVTDSKTVGNPSKRNSHCQGFRPHMAAVACIIQFDTGPPNARETGIATMNAAVMRARHAAGNHLVRYRITPGKK